MKEKIIEFSLEEILGDQEIALSLLEVNNPNFINSKIIKEDNILKIIFYFDESKYYTWIEVCEMKIVDRIRHLLNILKLYDNLKNSYFTYQLEPENLLFDYNALAYLLSKGIYKQVSPYDSISEIEFIKVYQAMAISLLDRKKSFKELVDGQLDFYKGTFLSEKIIKATSLEQLKNILEAEYQKESKNLIVNFTIISKKLFNYMKISMIFISCVAIVACLLSGYMLLDYLPKEKNIANIRLAFINNNFTDVITLAKNVDANKISQDDKYLIAYSTIMTEPLTNEQKNELSKISVRSSEAYLRYWMMIGQQKIEQAIDIASFLDDPQLLMYALTKKIDDIQRNPNLSAEDRSTKISDLKNKLDELKKKYLLPDSLEE